MSTLSRVFDYWAHHGGADQLPKWRQLLEMSLLYFFRRIGPGYYVQARWGRATIPFREKWSHMNRSEYRAFVAHWNRGDYQKASQHKYLEKSVLQQAGIPTAPMIAYVHRLHGRAADGSPIRNAAQLEQLLARWPGKRLCFKQAEGFGGFGFASYVISIDAGSVRMIDQATRNAVTPGQWWQRNGADDEGFVIEEYLVQHERVARINASSVNTVRMWVTHTDHLTTLAGCYLRLGRASSQVDNVSSGGLWCSVDPDSGHILKLYDPKASSQVLAAHPDSNVALEGYALPDWDRARTLAMNAIAAFPHVGVVGLDIAFTSTGPVIVELNVIPDYVGCARMDLPLKLLDRRMRGLQS